MNWGAWGRIGDSPVLATGCHATVRLWDSTSGDPHGLDLTGHKNTVWWGAWGRIGDSPVLATGGHEHNVRLWDTTTGSYRRPLIGHTDTVRWGTWGQLSNKPMLATGGGDGTVWLWDLTTDRPSGSALNGHTGPVRWGAWGRVNNKPMLATGGGDGTVWLWDLTTDPPSASALAGHTGPVLWGAWAEIGNRVRLATGGADRTVRLWDPTSNPPHVSALTGHTAAVWWGTWGEFGNRAMLATGGYDGTVRFWDPTTGQAHEPATDGHKGTVLWGAQCQVGNRPVLATGGDDGTIRLWDPTTGHAYGQAPTNHNGPVLWGAWGQVDNKPTLATGGQDGAVRLWDLARESVVPSLRISSDASRPTDLPDRPADLLDRQTDLTALADVITAKSVKPPLAIGLFGQWGDGKSLFLEMLEQRVREQAQSAGPEHGVAHHWVRQVRFNAWHYAESDLWASLVAELFAQLSAPSSSVDVAQEHRQRSRLASELIVARGVHEQLAAAQARLADLQKATSSQRSWQALPDAARQRLQELLSKKAYQRMAANVSTISATRRSLAGLLRAFPRGYFFIAVAIALVGAAGLTWGPGLIHRWGAISAAAAGFVVVLGGFGNAWKGSRPLRDQLGSAWGAFQQLLDNQAYRLKTAEDLATAEVAELQTRIQNLTAAGQLAGLVQERVGAGAYRQRLGLMTQIRQDFEHMAQLLIDADKPSDAEPPDVAGDNLPRIRRIVIYVDDLDRCPADRVVEVLEAIHLLLAVRLFVVVVAVDPRWLLRSLTSHYRQLFTANSDSSHTPNGTLPRSTIDLGEEERWASTPSQYLEKIFQIVLTLPPMLPKAYERMIDDLVGLRADAEPQTSTTASAPATSTTASAPATSATASAPATSTAASVPASAPPTPWAGSIPASNQSVRRQESQARWSLKSLTVIKRFDPLALTPDERRLIGLLGPPLITSPRAVKRLANSYGLLIAISNSQGLSTQRPDLQPVASDQEAYPYRASMVLLAAVIGFPMLGPIFFPALYRAPKTHPTHTWNSYLDALRPVHSTEWANCLEASMTASRAQHWTAFLDILDNITRLAEEAMLPLPQGLNIWADQVVVVGRLSFPTGSVVTRLV